MAIRVSLGSTIRGARCACRRTDGAFIFQAHSTCLREIYHFASMVIRNRSSGLIKVMLEQSCYRRKRFEGRLAGTKVRDLYSDGRKVGVLTCSSYRQWTQFTATTNTGREIVSAGIPSSFLHPRAIAKSEPLRITTALIPMEMAPLMSMSIL